MWSKNNLHNFSTVNAILQFIGTIAVCTHISVSMHGIGIDSLGRFTIISCYKLRGLWAKNLAFEDCLCVCGYSTETDATSDCSVVVTAC